MNERPGWLFRTVWTFLGPLVTLVLGYLVFRPTEPDRVYWQGAVNFGLIAGAAAYAQAVWARRWRLSLPPTEFALLVGIASSAGMAMKVAFIGVPGAASPWLWIGTALVAQLLVIAAPVSALRQAGVDLRRWWTVNLLATLGHFVTVQLMAVWASRRFREGGFTAESSASTARVERWADLTVSIFLAYMISGAIWAAVRRRREEARE